MNREHLQRAVEWGLVRVPARKFTVTGKLSVSRELFRDIIDYGGGLFSNSISLSTDYLIVPDGEFRKGSKYRYARENALMILRESEFCEMIVPSLGDLRL